MEVYTELFRLPRFQRDLTKTLMSLLKKAVLPRSTRSTQRINRKNSVLFARPGPLRSTGVISVVNFCPFPLKTVESLFL